MLNPARIVSAQGRRARDATRFTLTGGVARFQAVGEVVQERLGLQWVPFPENPQLAAALGAALLEEAETDEAETDEAETDETETDETDPPAVRDPTPSGSHLADPPTTTHEPVRPQARPHSGSPQP